MIQRKLKILIDIFLAFSMLAIWIYCIGMTLEFWELDMINFYGFPLMSLIVFVVLSTFGTDVGGIFAMRFFRYYVATAQFNKKYLKIMQIY